MPPETGVFEAFYGSALQHPILLWIAAASAGLWCLGRPGLDPGVRRFCVALAVLSLIDAWLTSGHVYGVGTLEAPLSSAVPLCFVLAGDFRYLLLLGIAEPGGRLAPRPRRVAVALGLTGIVPLLSQAVMAVLPPAASGARVLFLVYEVAFFALVLALVRWHPGARRAPWLTPVSRAVLAYYALWALADALILATGSDLGFALRVVPNVLYYGGLVAAIGWAASRAPDGRTG